MAERVRVSDLDFIYISYTEPNKEQISRTRYHGPNVLME